MSHPIEMVLDSLTGSTSYDLNVTEIIIMRIQYTQTNKTRHHQNQPNVTACYLIRNADPDNQLFVSFPGERVIFEAIDYEGNLLGYIGRHGLTPSKGEAVLQQGNQNILIHDCDHVKWIKKVTLH